jgi:hypothetical protein
VSKEKIQNQLLTNVTITALSDFPDSNLVLNIVVIDKKQDLNGVSYSNIVRKLLPDAGGTAIKRIWTQGDVYQSPTFTWNVPSTIHIDSLEVVAFLQNKDSKTIYQTAYSGVLIDKGNANSNNEHINHSIKFTIYPNPVQDKLFIYADNLTNVSVNIIDMLGNKRYSIPHLHYETSVDVSMLNEGVYLLQIRNGEGGILSNIKFVVKR